MLLHSDADDDALTQDSGTPLPTARSSDEIEAALERATILGAVSTPSLPALESDCGMTPDRRLGWRFMESLGEEVTTLAAASGGVADEDNSVPKRCYRAIKMGLQLLNALRPLHARRRLLHPLCHYACLPCSWVLEPVQPLLIAEA